MITRLVRGPLPVRATPRGAFTSTPRALLGIDHSHHDEENDSSKEIALRWNRRDGSVMATKARVGANLLRSAQRYEIELEGACEGVCACSTCHCILPEDVYSRLPEASEDEEDMLDQAFGLTACSRLGCQVVVTEDMHNTLITIPSATRNFYVDGHVPKPH